MQKSLGRSFVETAMVAVVATIVVLLGQSLYEHGFPLVSMYFVLLSGAGILGGLLVLNARWSHTPELELEVLHIPVIKTTEEGNALVDRLSAEHTKGLKGKRPLTRKK